MQAALRKLDKAVNDFSESISNFPVRAVTIEDYYPLERKIQIARESLKRLNTRLLTFKAKHSNQLDGRQLEEEEELEIFKNLQKVTSRSILCDKAIRLSLHSDAINKILSGSEGNEDTKQEIYTNMRHLFTLNDEMIALQQRIVSAYQQQLDLKIECLNALYKYKVFLKEQEEIRARKLEGTKPEITKGKQKVEKLINRINVMKRLVTSFVASSGEKLVQEPILLSMLQKHRKLLTMEQVGKMLEIDTGEDT